MDWGTIVVAIISFLGTVVGSYSGMKLMSYRIEQLEKRVERHNGFGEKIPVIEEHLKTIDHRLDELENKVG